jgi:hypothetical protein
VCPTQPVNYKDNGKDDVFSFNSFSPSRHVVSDEQFPISKKSARKSLINQETFMTLERRASLTNELAMNMRKE